MVYDEPPNFCTSCGAPLRDSDEFCKSCGTSRIGGTETGPREQYGRARTGTKNTLTILGILCAVWAIISLFEGISAISSVDALLDSMKGYTEYWDIISETIGENTLRAMFSAIGALFVISGILSAVTALLCFLKRFYTIALVTCLIASVCVLVGLVGIIGLIVAFFIHKNKDSFARNTHL
ncbi:MAG: zinc ribbon domain-containing protein [Candidatus Methanoplasma sp.]|jgi:uncharacterized membrane protein HdeD (DUF308 family)|nr:zinc ribbon domain-containing protein [Candidatus Methanoplasma sp.]